MTVEVPKDADWYYLAGGQQRGPLSAAALMAKFSQGDLPRNTPVWRKGQENWTPADQLEEFSSQAPPPIPPQYQEPPWYKVALNKPTPNRLATVGVSLAVVSVFLYQIVIIPVLALAFRVAGLVRASRMAGIGRKQALIGMFLSILYLFVYLGRLAQQR